MKEVQTLAAALAELERAAEPLRDSIRSDDGRARLFDTLGWSGAAIVDGAVEQAISAIVVEVDTVVELASGNLDDFGKILDAIQSIGTLVTALDQLGTAANKGTLAALAQPQLIGELAEDVLSFLVARYLRVHHPWLYLISLALTVIDNDAPQRTALELPNHVEIRRPAPRYQLRFDNVPKLIQDP